MNKETRRIILSDINIEQTTETSATANSARPLSQDEQEYSSSHPSDRSTEDDIRAQLPKRKNNTQSVIDREPMFVIVDSSGVSNPSSRELLADRKTNLTDAIIVKCLNKNVIPSDLPSTSRNIASEIFQFASVGESVSRDELQMIDINLQSENEISMPAGAIVSAESDKESVVISYLRKKEAPEMEGMMLASKKKSTLLGSTSKLETIIEGKQFVPKSELAPDMKSNEDDVED